MSGKQRVAVIGGGYAGVTAANRLAASLTPGERTSIKVALYTATPAFTERIRLHEFAAGSRDSAEVAYGSLLREDIEVVAGRVVRIDTTRRTLVVADGTSEEAFDYLIYATGMVTTPPPGALAVGDPDGACAIRARLADAGDGSLVVVIGGGATGVETAAEIAQRHPRLTTILVCRDGPLPTLPEKTRLRVRSGLERLGVRIVGTGVAETMTPAVTVWAGTPAASPLARDSRLPTDEHGRLLVDETLRCPAEPSVFGAGDAVHIPESVGAHLRPSCAAAIPLGGHAADCVLAALRGQPGTSVDVGFMLQCYSLGRRDGVVQFVRPDDSPRRLRLSGGLAARVKETICKMTVDGVRKEGVKPHSYPTPKGPKVRP